MAQTKLTKTQLQLLDLLAKGNALVDCRIDDRTFSFETVLLLQRRRLVDEDVTGRGSYGDPSFFDLPRRYFITDRGRAVLAKGGLVPKKLSKRQREVLLDGAGGLEIILENPDNLRRHFPGDKAVDIFTNSHPVQPGPPPTSRGRAAARTGPGLSPVRPLPGGSHHCRECWGSERDTAGSSTANTALTYGRDGAMAS